MASTCRVYPRVCGGTAALHAVVERRLGLSPRVRGNLGGGSPATVARGSIPACAGEPRLPTGTSSSVGVYPRVCGGTTALIRASIWCIGLSPRVRGNLDSACRRLPLHRSIPACAGEPYARGNAGSEDRVYPRVCGGTSNRLPSAARRRGLSPRVRGNPGGIRGADRRVRSIPACAGEPQPYRQSSRGGWVYPRVCGGTWCARCGMTRRRGLSPRVRGNRHKALPLFGCKGSIPACAGEPARGGDG